MRGVLNKILLSTMIIAFTWVIIGDLVNMHMKLIYKKDLTEHNSYYTKSNKSNKKDYLISAKIVNKVNNIANISKNSFNCHISANYSSLINTEIISYTTNNLSLSLLLRGPPSFI